MNAKPRKMIRVFEDEWKAIHDSVWEKTEQLAAEKNKLSALENEMKVLKHEVNDLTRRTEMHRSIVEDLRDSLYSQEKKVWVKAWVAVASADNSLESGTATHWADKCLADYRKRFPAPTSDDNS